VHSPEFSFEHDIDNVRRAAKDMRVAYPIAIDNDYAIWSAFDNHYWPALYLVDAQGRIRSHQFGEGAYEQSEMMIQQLLAEACISGIAHELVSVDAQGTEAAADWGDLRSPENYVGDARTENFASPGGAVVDQPRVYATPAHFSLNQWALAGEWTVGREATLPAIYIWSWDQRRGERPCAFACSSMDRHRARLMEVTLTTRATVRLPTSGCIN